VTLEVETATKNPFSGQETRKSFCNKRDLTPTALGVCYYTQKRDKTNAVIFTASH